MTLWLTIIAIGLITFGLRFSFIYFLGNREVPSWAQHFLSFVPIAVFSALILPGLFLPAGSVFLSIHNTRLLAGLVAIVVAWRTRNVLLTIVVGMGSFWVLQALLG